MLQTQICHSQSVMAKGSKSKGSDSKGAKQQGKAAKCTCDHPFQCSCGNRPERPSKGHKWYPETQTWAGKGHKQKGASGQIASVAQQAKVTEASTVVAQWQRLPTQILQEYCQRQKRPLPAYKELANDKSNDTAKQRGIKFRVILRDPKKNDSKDLIFIPKHTVANVEQAKQEAALLALLQVTPSLPHERKLPEPYKTTWLNAVAAAKKEPAKVQSSVSESNSANRKPNDTESTASTQHSKVATASQSLELANRFVSQAEREKQRAAVNASKKQRQRQRENIEDANKDHPVLLSSEFRQKIEELLRQHDETDDSDSPPVTETLRIQLSQAGFAERQIDLARGESFEECVQYLVVRLPEDELPESYDPRGQTLDVVVAPGTSAVTLLRYGISKPEASRVMKIQRERKDDASLFDVMWSMLCELTGYVNPETVPTREQKITAIEMLDEELETLKAIYDNDVAIEEFPGGLVQITIANQVELMVKKGHYPVTAHFERVLVRDAATALYVSVIEELKNTPLGEMMMYALYATIQDLLADLDTLPRRSLLDYIGNEPSRPLPITSNVNGSAKRRSTRSRRPRSKYPSFWSLSPTKAQPAGPPSGAMSNIRRQLPAATSRDSFLLAVRNNRVVLITGETGSGMLCLGMPISESPFLTFLDTQGSQRNCLLIFSRIVRIRQRSLLPNLGDWLLPELLLA